MIKYKVVNHPHFIEFYRVLSIQEIPIVDDIDRDISLAALKKLHKPIPYYRQYEVLLENHQLLAMNEHEISGIEVNDHVRYDVFTDGYISYDPKQFENNPKLIRVS